MLKVLSTLTLLWHTRRVFGLRTGLADPYRGCFLGDGEGVGEGSNGLSFFSREFRALLQAIWLPGFCSLLVRVDMKRLVGNCNTGFMLCVEEAASGRDHVIGMLCSPDKVSSACPHLKFQTALWGHLSCLF